MLPQIYVYMRAITLKTHMTGWHDQSAQESSRGQFGVEEANDYYALRLIPKITRLVCKQA